MTRFAFESQWNTTITHHLTENSDQRGFPVIGVRITDSDDFVAEAKACRSGVRLRCYASDRRRQHHDAAGKQRPVSDDRKYEIERGTGK